MTSFGDELCVRFMHTFIARDGVCCAEVEVKQFLPAEYMGLQLRQWKQHAMVRLHCGIPHGITMVRPRGNIAWPSMVNHGGPLYTIVRQCGNITGNVSLSYRGTALSSSR